MEREYRTIDKSEWGDGPWQAEPDKVQWKDTATGLPCLAVRHRSSGHWCGYVGVAEGHPSFGRDYDDVPADVHGGLTFASHCQEGPEAEAEGVCHIPDPGQPDRVWWLGFDCAHGGDLTPAHEARMAEYPGLRPFLRAGVYRDLEYVRGECAGLAKQLAEQAA